MPPKEKRSMRPALGLEKELVKDEISTALHTGVEKLEGKAAPKQRVDNFHNTKFLLKQYRRVAYSVLISESELNLRMEMEHGTRLSTLEVNAELAGIDLSNTKLESHTKSVIRSKTMLDIINTALEAVRQDPDRGELMYPDGLSGLSLYPWVQIASLADVFVALTEERSYRAAYTQEEAWKMIQQGECGAFNSSILRCLDRNQDKWMESLV